MQSLSICTPLESLSNTYKNVLAKAMFTLTVFDILLFVGRTVLPPAQRAVPRERVKVSVKNKNNIRLLLKLLEKWLAYKLRWFWVVFKFFFFFFCFSTLSVQEKLKNVILEMPIIPQTLNIYSLKTFCNGNVCSYRFRGIAVRR